MKVDWLAHHRNLIPVLANWTFDEWGKFDPTDSLKRAISRFNSRCNINKIPFALVALEDDTPLGCISVKPEALPNSKYP